MQKLEYINEEETLEQLLKRDTHIKPTNNNGRCVSHIICWHDRKEKPLLYELLCEHEKLEEIEVSNKLVKEAVNPKVFELLKFFDMVGIYRKIGDETVLDCFDWIDICDYEDNIIDPINDTVNFYLPKERHKIS